MGLEASSPRYSAQYISCIPHDPFLLPFLLHPTRLMLSPEYLRYKLF